MNIDRFDRNVRFFGKDGQEHLRAANVVIVGVGGLGTHVVQQLSLLGIGSVGLIDNEECDETNRNRYVGARYDDPMPGTRKVDLGEGIVHAIDPAVHVSKVFNSVVSEEAFATIRNTDYVFGCLDSEGPRLILTELCAAYCIPYFDLASDIVPGDRPSYGGRVCAAWDGHGCPVCLAVLDLTEAQRNLAGPETQRDLDKIYGVNRALLGTAGPSVVSINGVVASLAVTEFIVGVTGIRRPHHLLTYFGHLGKVTVNTDKPQSDCYYCKGIRGYRKEADVERYIRSAFGDWLR
jgi:hypothetical protein